MLSRWAAKWGWYVKAPAEPTFVTRLGHSTVDLFLTKSISTTEELWIPKSDWDGASDHHPVIMEVDKQPHKETRKEKLHTKEKTLLPRKPKKRTQYSKKEPPREYQEMHRSNDLGRDRSHTCEL
eukprot:IDg5630t1